MGIPS